MLFSFELEPAPTVEGLSPVEQEVLTLVLDGWSNAAIARSRGTSPRTVANQVASIFRKAQVGSRAALTAKLLG